MELVKWNRMKWLKESNQTFVFESDEIQEVLQEWTGASRSLNRPFIDMWNYDFEEKPVVKFDFYDNRSEKMRPTHNRGT